MFDSSKPDDDVVNFVSKLKSHMQSLHPKPPKHHGKRPVFIHPGLLEATHVFLRRDMLRRPLQQPYDGPFKVLQRKDKVFSLTSMVNGYLYLMIDANLPSFLTLRTCNYLKPRMKHLLLWNLIQQFQRLPSHLHVLVAKFIFQLGIVDTGRGVCSDLTAQHNDSKTELN
ncbi:uncharacterized protein TNCV_1125881 [Trichonephila clavipes]|nr:uncharacterized protein TNCV_1125881 [Trichonephila clavipes]